MDELIIPKAAFAGLTYPQTRAPFTLNHMLDVLGKEERDTYSFENVEVGLCGQKLWHSEKSQIHLGFIGRLENPKELQESLNSFSYPKADCDQSLAGMCYELWGRSFLEKLKGNFALFILDQRKKRLILARSPLCTTPLFWSWNQGHLIFSTQLKAMLTSGLVPQHPSSQGLAQYLYLGYIPEDVSMIEKVNKLLPGYFLESNFSGGLSVKSFWSLSSFFAKNELKSQEEIEESLKQHLQKEVFENRRFLPLNSVGLRLGKKVFKAKPTLIYFQESEGVLPPPRKGPYEALSLSPKKLTESLSQMLWNYEEPLGNLNDSFVFFFLRKNTQEPLLQLAGLEELITGSLSPSYQPEFKQGLYQSLYQISKKLLPRNRVPLNLIKQAQRYPRLLHFFEAQALFPSKEMKKVSPFLYEQFDPCTFIRKFTQLEKLGSLDRRLSYLSMKTRLYSKELPLFCNQTHPHLELPLTQQTLVEDLVGCNLEAIRSSLAPYLEPLDTEPTLPNLPHLEWIQAPLFRQAFHFLEKGTLVSEGFVSQKWIRSELIKWHSSSHKKAFQAFSHLFSLLVLEFWFSLYIDHPLSKNFEPLSAKSLLAEEVSL